MADHSQAGQQVWEAELLRLLVENVKDYAIFIVDTENRVQTWNPGAQRLLGYTAEEIVGRSSALFFTPEDRQAGIPEQERQKALATGRGEDDRWHVRKDGSRFWSNGVMTPLRDKDGTLRGFAKIMRDNTALKQAAEAAQERERLTAFEKAISHTLTHGDGLSNTLHLCAAAMVQHLDVTLARIWILPEQGDVLELQASAGLYSHTDGAHSRIRVGEFKIGLIAQEKRPHLTNAVVGDPRVHDQAWAQREGLVSFAGYPLVIEERVVGVMAVFARHPLTEATLQAMAAVANEIAFAILRYRAEEALRQSEERFRGLMEQAPFSIQIFSPDGRTVQVNRAWEELWGVTFAQIADYNVLQDPQLETKGVAPYLRRAFAGEPTTIPAIQYDPEETLPERSRYPDARRWVSAVAYPLKDATGQVREVVLVHEDITARRRAEERLHFLSEASSVLAASLDEGVTLQKLAELTVPQMADWCSVDILLEDQTIRRVAVVHPDPAKMQLGQELLRRYPLQLEMPEGTVLRSGQSVLHPEITEEMLVAFAHDADHLAILRTLQLQSTMIVPLRARGRILGVISLVTAESGRRYGPEDLALAEALARRAALAVDNARLYRLAQEALRQKEESLALLDTLQRNAPIGFAFVDRQFRYVRINEALAAIDGWPAAELLGKTVQEAVPTLWPRLEPLYRRVLESGQPLLNLEVSGQTPAAPGQARHWLVNYYPVRVQDEIVGLGILVMDITELKRLEAELRQRAEQLAQADRLKDEFLAMLAHELRNPLAPIRNALHIMKQPAADAAMMQQVRNMAERQVQHMARLLDDLLDVSRISRGKIELRREPVDVAAIINRTVEAIRPLIEQRRHELTVALPAGPLRVEADPTRLEQVLTNLLNNAAKYTDPGGHIWLSAGQEEGMAVLRVRDTGIGIAPEMLPRVFDLFVQVERRLDRSQGGVGIGLTLVKKLVELHGGSITAHSSGLGQGSEFVIRLPMLGMAALTEKERTGHGDSTSILPCHRVLVVDDNHDAADSLALLLKLAGQDVQAAYDGPSALTRAEEFLPHLVFLDLGMPGMDGYEVAQRLRQQPGGTKMLLVAVTGWGQEEDRRRSQEAGFDGHMVKPTDPDTLRQFFTDPRLT
jgi:PAS domain S-box-containing protein